MWIAQLAPLSAWQLGAFAGSCAHRIGVVVEYFAGESERTVFRRCLSAIWAGQGEVRLEAHSGLQRDIRANLREDPGGAEILVTDGLITAGYAVTACLGGEEALAAAERSAITSSDLWEQVGQFALDVFDGGTNVAQSLTAVQEFEYEAQRSLLTAATSMDRDAFIQLAQEIPDYLDDIHTSLRLLASAHDWVIRQSRG
jgi:hypothetical protein